MPFRVCSNDFSLALVWLIDNHSANIGRDDDNADDCDADADDDDDFKANSCNAVAAAQNSPHQRNTNANIQNVRALLEIVRIHYHSERLPASPQSLIELIEMGFETESIEAAMRATCNNIGLAIEWMCGDRRLAIEEAQNGFPHDSPVLRVLQDNPHFQMGLSNPKMFMGESKGEHVEWGIAPPDTIN